jgi:hypothetical protein
MKDTSDLSMLKVGFLKKKLKTLKMLIRKKL